MDNLLEFLFGRDVPGQLNILAQTLLPAIWETVYSTLLATLLAYLIGLPLGVLLVVGEPGGIRPLPRPVMKTLNILVNILRSVPFLILMIMDIPLSRLILGTSVGTVALLVPLVIAAFPFVSRLVEGSLRDADGGVIEAAQAMGCSPGRIIRAVLLPECLPSLITGFTTALITIMGYGAMAGVLGGGGLGAMAINYGYYRKQTLVMYTAVILLVLLVQLIQSLGTRLSSAVDRRDTRTAQRISLKGGEKTAL